MNTAYGWDQGRASRMRPWRMRPWRARRAGTALQLKLGLCLGAAWALAAPARADLSFGEAYTWPRVGPGSGSAANVRAVQYLLRAQGYKVEVDGRFGKHSRARLMQFQARQKARGRDVEVDGELGPRDAEWQQLLPMLGTPSSNSWAVRAAQSLLRSKGYSVAIDGVYGEQTDSAVQKFQMAHDRNGIGGIAHNDWCELMGGKVRYE